MLGAEKTSGITLEWSHLFAQHIMLRDAYLLDGCEYLGAYGRELAGEIKSRYGPGADVRTGCFFAYHYYGL